MLYFSRVNRSLVGQQKLYIRSKGLGRSRRLLCRGALYFQLQDKTTPCSHQTRFPDGYWIKKCIQCYSAGPSPKWVLDLSQPSIFSTQNFSWKVVCMIPLAQTFVITQTKWIPSCPLMTTTHHSWLVPYDLLKTCYKWLYS